MSSILSLDKKVDELLSFISEAEDLKINQLLASKIAFQLSKISFGLQLIKRLQKLYHLQEVIEDRLLNEDVIKDLSIRELLVMSSVNSKRLDNYFTKMDKILSSIKINELEGALLVLSEMDRKDASRLEIQSDDSVKALSLQLLSTISQIQNTQNEMKREGSIIDANPSDKFTEADIDVSNMIDSQVDKLDEIGDNYD